MLFGVDRTDRTDVGLVARSAGRAFFEVHVQDAVPEDPNGIGIRGVGGLDGPAARFVLGEQHVLLRIELIDALHRADIDAGAIFTSMHASVMIARPAMSQILCAALLSPLGQIFHSTEAGESGR